MGVKWRTFCDLSDAVYYRDGYHNTVKKSDSYFSADGHEWQCPKCGKWSHESKIPDACFLCPYSYVRTEGPPGCFITTATLLSLGKDDNCYELQMFRKFRDTYLKDKYPELIKQYYQLTPKIVNSINVLPSKDDVYKNIWEQYLIKCLSLIEISQFEATKTLYQKMVEDLSARVLV